MKKWLTLGVSLVLAMAMLAGCGDASTPTDGEGTTDPATTGTVSYTHLDVYKRQAWRIG